MGRRVLDIPADIDRAWLREQVVVAVTRTGLVGASADGRLAFVHHTVREFLAAKRLAKLHGPEYGREVTRLWSADGFREIVLFVLAIWAKGGADVSPLVGAIAAEPDGALFAGQAMVEHVPLSDEVQRLVGVALKEAAERATSGITMLRAVRLLGAAHDPHALELLIHLVPRRRAERSLGGCRFTYPCRLSGRSGRGAGRTHRWTGRAPA